MRARERVCTRVRTRACTRIRARTSERGRWRIGYTVPMVQLPRSDELTESPIDFANIPLGVGQEGNAYGQSTSFQFTKEGDAIHQTDVRRNPDETFLILSRPPWRW